MWRKRLRTPGGQQVALFWPGLTNGPGAATPATIYTFLFNFSAASRSGYEWLLWEDFFM